MEEQQYNPQPVQAYNAPPGLPPMPYVPYGMTPQTMVERRDLRFRALLITVALLVMVAVRFLWSLVYVLIMRLMGYTVDYSLYLISEPGISQVVQILFSIIVFIIPFSLAAKIGRFRISDVVPLGRPAKGTSLPFFFFGLGFCAFANIAVSVAGSIFETMGFEYSVDFGKNPQGLFGFFLSVIATAITPALAEEFACRGVMHGLLEKYGEGFAVMVSAILFGAMHGNFIQIPFAFLVGVVLGFVRVKTGTLWICVLVHGANNLVSVLLDYFTENMSIMMQNMLYAVFLAASMLLGLVGLLLLRRCEDTVYRFNAPETEATGKQKYKWFFTVPAVIVFLVICLIESIFFV